MTSRAGTLCAPPDTSAYRQAMGRFATGVTLLTCGSGEDTVVVTLNSLTSVSLDPLLLLVSVHADGRLRSIVGAGGSFAVNVLADNQRDLAEEFGHAGRATGLPAMRRTGAVEGVTGDAVIPDSEATFTCELYAEYEAGDHVLLLGRVVDLSCGPDGGSAPLLFHRGRLHAFDRHLQEAAA